ncbi:MAG: hypothetical protein HON53_13095 [Planctomycetaceae bacterium]|nr:hypothetical protein [Planctomycetaceae bacterium]MBT6157579.1 hypothetical protein [Planctomycetaceae bacterium]MBT6488020.1 hypothetical protein [Planctomycetaceae bacterium]MBT6497841.1 hypothetical protein [Planctomycetaceae bacterium]
MRLFVAGLLLLGVAANANADQTRKFPYEAVVDADSVFVHSGPGKKYYATSRMSQSEHVIVHRHDPGGWYMISPPAGSFSWIRADAVEHVSRRRGVLTDNNVVVRVGSSLDDSRDVFQSRLSKGSRVEIIGEQVVRTQSGPIRMLKITPPKGEWRWIPGQAVTPVGQNARRQRDNDPYSIPSHARDHRQRQPAAGVPSRSNDYDGPVLKRQPDDRNSTGEFIERPIRRSINENAIRRSGPISEEVLRDRTRLQQLDTAFRTIIQHETGEWNFSELRHGYVDLQKSASHPALASQIDLRLASLARYEEIKANYDGFIQLTAEVGRRDAQLMALQEEQLNATAAQTETQPATFTQETVPAASASSQQPQFAAPVPQPEEIQYSSSPTPQQPPLPAQSSSETLTQVIPGPAATFQQPTPATPTSITTDSLAPPIPAEPQAQSLPRLKGAGIIQRAISQNPKAPRHVLLAPNGQILAYLQGAAGVSLDQHLGKQMGIEGLRLHRPELQMNVFLVQSLEPVKLR